MTFDSNKACERSTRLWLRMGRLLERLAYEQAEDPLRRDRAIELAAMAECCFWQATGESSPFELRDFVSKAEGQP